MKAMRYRFLLGGLAAGFLVPVVPAEDAAPSDNPYRGITRRNAFGLREPAPPPVPPPVAPPTPPVDKVDVKLAGVSQIGPLRYAHLMLPDKDRPGQFLYPTLTDNPAHGNTRNSSIEVIEIDPLGETVRIRNAGNEMTLTFAEHGIKGAPAAPVVPGRPGAPGAPAVPAAPGAVAVQPPGRAVAAPAMNPNAGPVVFSSRAGVATDGTPQPSPAQQAVNLLNNVAATPEAAAPAVPQNFARPLRTQGGRGVEAGAMPLPEAPPVQQQIQNAVIQQQAAQQLGIPLPPFPGLPQPGGQ